MIELFQYFFSRSVNCGTLRLAVSPQGNVTVKTLCSFDKLVKTGMELIGNTIKVGISIMHGSGVD